LLLNFITGSAKASETVAGFVDHADCAKEGNAASAQAKEEGVLE
jgi:hypothetical protein